MKDKAQEILDNLQKLQKTKIRWGVEGEELAKIMFWLEFGTNKKDGSVKQPERPFYRSTFNSSETHKKIEAATGVAITNIMEGQDFDKNADMIGEVGLGCLMRTFASNVPPPNAESTIKRKGQGKNTGYDTGLLQAHQGYEVVQA